MTKPSGAFTITARMSDYFKRQIAAFEQMLEALTVLDHDMDEAELEALVTIQDRHSRQTNELAREFRALLKEWQAGVGIQEADRVAVGRYARRAEHLAAQVEVRCAQGNALVQGKMQALRDSLDEVAVGRDLLRKYSPTAQHEPSYLDRKA
jgi:hypothetical protein